MDIFFVILFCTGLYTAIVYFTETKGSPQSSNVPWILYTVHFILTLTYILYTSSSSSDSFKYFRVSAASENWLELFGNGTTFIYFFAWPFTHVLGLSYYAVMALFSFFGLVGIYLLYRAANENINSQAKLIQGLGIVELVFLLPNLHFWTSSLGKGSVMILGMGLLFWGLSRFNRRPGFIIAGLAIVYFTRPHILLAVVLGTVCGLIFTNSGIKAYFKWAIILLSLVVFYFTSDNVIEFANTDGLNILDTNSSEMFQHKVSSLGRAGTGVDIQNYSLPMKLFTFWFRPLFVDAPGVMGFISSIENLIYLYMFFILITELIGIWNELNGWFKISLFVFLIASLALAQISGNLGIAMRQKAQVMPLFFIVFAQVRSLYQSRQNFKRSFAAVA